MPTTDEKNILKILEEEGGELGELHEVKISRYMGLRLDYLRTILGSMGRRDLIDVFGNGRVKISDKGWRALGKTPPSPWDKLAGAKLAGAPESTNESPEEKYKKWMSGKAKEATKGNPEGTRGEPKKERVPEKKDASESPSFDSYTDLSPQERFKKWASK